jgi:hypothetical protein
MARTRKYVSGVLSLFGYRTVESLEDVEIYNITTDGWIYYREGVSNYRVRYDTAPALVS